MKKTLPVFELLVDDVDAFVSEIALVESPAIERTFLAFNKQELQKFQFNEERQELFGPAIIPDQKIYRRDNDGTEYQVFFSKDTIRKIAQSFFKRGFQNQLNIEHTATAADSYIFQSAIVDKANGIAPMDLPDGSWVVGVKVLNNDIWKDIKEGKRTGFSIEGAFLLSSSFKKNISTIINNKEDGEEVLEMLQQIQNLIKKKI